MNAFFIKQITMSASGLQWYCKWM